MGLQRDIVDRAVEGKVAIVGSDDGHDCNLSLDGAVNNVALKPHRATI